MMGAISDDHAAAGMRGYRYKHGDRPLPGYTIQRAAGRGGFGEVYYALSDSGREVALKVVHAYEEVELRGISQCMNLKSPHLVSIFDVRTADDGRPVVIMEYVSGPSLRELLDEAPAGFGTQKAAFFLREIGKGLTYLHDCGIVHRDLKPANIFYENGYVKIVDYGLSKVISASHRSAQTVTVGTLHYMAPEVGGGRYDRSVDIYALGALLYEMLTGQPPFFGISPAEVLMKHISAPVNVDGIEEPFATVIRRALAKDPAERYQTVQEMVEAVFGAEHVQQSVSCFSPADLTVVAGRVAQHARLRGTQAAASPPAPLSSRAFEVGRDTPAGSMLGTVVRHVRDQVRPWVGRATGLLGRARATVLPRFGVPVAPPAPPAPPPPPAPLVDPVSVGNRIFLALVAAVAVGVAAGAFSDGAYPILSGIFVLLGIAGATAGVRLASIKVLPGLGNESRLLQHLAGGGLAAMFMLVVALPAWVPAANMRPAPAMVVDGYETIVSRDPRVIVPSVRVPNVRMVSSYRRMNVGGTLAAICVSLLVINWARRIAARRADRVSLKHLLTAGLVAGLATAVLGAAPEVVIGVVCGTSIAVQIASPWLGAAGRSQVATGGAPSPTPTTAATGVSDAVAPANVDRAPAGIGPATAPQQHPFEFASVYDIARRSVAVANAAVVWPIRAALYLVAGVLLLATFLAALGVAIDVPGLIASGRIDSRWPQQIQHEMEIENWPLVVRSLSVAGMFVAACLAVTLLMWLRRSSGGLHMVRVIAGAALLIAAPFILAGKGVDWGPPVAGQLTGGWEFWQTLVRGVSPSAAARAAIMAVGGVLLLLWPAPRANGAGGTPARAASASNAAAGTDVAR